MNIKTTIAMIVCIGTGFASAKLLSGFTSTQGAQITPPPASVSPSGDDDDHKGRSFKWDAGGKDGITLDVLIKATPQGSFHFIEKATLTIDKDGRIIKIEGKTGRTRIRS